MTEWMNHQSFWIYFLLTNFPTAIDEETDTSLTEFISENYEMDKNFIDDLTQYSEKSFEENDGYIGNPNYIEMKLENHTFKIEFHPGDILYFIDGKEIGSTGPHFIIKTIPLQLFYDLINSNTDERIPLLILPMLDLQSSEYDKIRKIIKIGLESINIRNEHISKITNMIISGLS